MHTDKGILWDLLKAEELAGMKLTESFSMMPASSVSALIFAHPASEYFAVGSITKDQVQSYSERIKMPIPQIEKWLGPILGYEN